MKSNTPALQNKEAVRKEKERIVKMVRAGLDNDYKELFSSPAGIRVLNDLLSQTHVFGLSFTFGGEKDQADFREGERNIGLKLIKRMMKINKSALFKAFETNLKQEYGKK